MAGMIVAGIIWLASYPKSGNTWLRTFLTNYQRDGDEPVDINGLNNSPIASARRAFDETVGVEASDLTPEEIDRYRPSVYSQIVENLEQSLFLKVHDAYTLNSEGQPLFPKSATQSVIYLIRNPLDVAVSFAHHSNITIPSMIDRMNNEDYAFADRDTRLHQQLRQKLLSWSSHVRSWVDESGLSVKVTRYEDLLRDAIPSFTAIVQAAGLPLDPNKVKKAVEFSSFERLQTMEREGGFRERAPRADSFFRKGTVGDWRNVLTEDQATQLISAHRVVMQRFGYLDNAGKPVY